MLISTHISISKSTLRLLLEEVGLQDGRRLFKGPPCHVLALQLRPVLEVGLDGPLKRRQGHERGGGQLLPRDGRADALALLPPLSEPPQATEILGATT